jgi:hypothetical protein
MLGFGKKLILVIFATGLLASNVFAAEPKLSGNYVYLEAISPPSEAITVLLIYRLKVTPNKTGRAGKILVVQSNTEGIEGVVSFQRGDMLNYRTEAGKLFISGFSCPKPTLDPTDTAGLVYLGLQETPLDCAKEKSFDIFYADFSSNKVARYAFVYWEEIRVLNNVLASNLSGTAVSSQTTQTVKVNSLGTLVRQ